MSDPPRSPAEDRISRVVERLLRERSITRSVGRADNLRDAGLSSMDMLNLVLAIESEFQLTIPESDISPGNFRSIEAISGLVDILLQQVS